MRGGDAAQPTLQRWRQAGRPQAGCTHAALMLPHLPLPTPLQAAMAAANAKPGVVLLPAGTYRLSQPLNITASGVVIRGEGVSGTGCFCEPSGGRLRRPEWRLADCGLLPPRRAGGGHPHFCHAVAGRHAAGHLGAEQRW